MREFVLSLGFYYLYIILKYRKAFYMLQQNSYNTSNRFIKWIFKNIRKTFITYELIIPLILIIINLINMDYIIPTLIIYFLAFVMELKLIKKEQQKKKFVVTKRVRRLIYTTIILFILMMYLIYINYNNEYLLYYYLITFLFGYVSFKMALIINIINIPAEKYVYYYYLNKAKGKLKDNKNLKKIGITGSYGKTSSKNILNTILSSKFISYPSPKSFNTPYGLMNAINNGLDKFDEVFIAEMGACQLNDIKVLCNFVKPQYGIITTIGLAHLETFKSEENIQKGKFELIESLPSDGVGILNMDDPKQTSYKIKNKCKIIWIGIDNDADVVATNIKLSYQGTSFDIKFKNDKTLYPFKTILLGKHNIYNILSSIALGKELGIDIPLLQDAVKMIKPIEHRLELKPYNDMYIIDDAFNSNPVGSKMALDVLNLMPGKKIVVTPGMIELGPKEYELNKKFGEYIASIADEVILVGEKQTKPILDGLKENKYKDQNIHILNNVKDAFPLVNRLKDGPTYVLLENDLPDIFSE